MKRVTTSFEAVAPLFDERSLDKVELSTRERVLRLTLEKARSLLNSYPDLPIVAADTLVDLNGKSIGKPKDREDAKRILHKLSGSVHKVFTGWAVLYRGKEISGVEEASVLIDSMTEQQIDYYVRTGSPLNKAGAYGIQDTEYIHSRILSGDRDTIVGFPVNRIREILFGLGVKSD